jgi:putative transposase
MRYFRKQLNLALATAGVQLQLQPYDHVLTEEQRERGAFEAVADYIIRNPERRSLVRADGFADYPYSGCMIPGYPELRLFQPDYWDRMWRTYSYLLRNRVAGPATDLMNRS